MTDHEPVEAPATDQEHTDHAPVPSADTTVDVPTPTGHPDVDAAMARLGDLDGLPVAEHVGVYDEVQERLAAAMEDARDSGPPSGDG